MTLLLRPFNFDTLSTYVYQFAKDELLEEAALAAVAIVVAGLGPVILMNASQKKMQQMKPFVKRMHNCSLNGDRTQTLELCTPCPYCEVSLLVIRQGCLPVWTTRGFLESSLQ